MPQFYVYVYRDPSRKNEAIYVGKGQGRRARSHLNRADMHPFTQRLQLMKKEGVEPIINVVDMPSEALAIQCEVDTIARFGRKDLKLGPLLNMTDGGEGTSGHVASPETRKKQSDARKGKSHSDEARAKMSDAQKGKSHSDEARAKMSDAKKGKSLSLETRAKMSDVRKGKPSPNKGKVHPKTICPHCGTEGGGSAMKQRHFDNCKHKKVS